MDLKDVATISGKSGLYRILKPTRSGVILETIDEQKSRIVAGATNRVSILKEISIYTNTEEGSVPLEQVFLNIYNTFGKDIKVTSKSSNDELKAFIEKVVPEYDEERVYVSDIKKMATWYTILVNHLPEEFENQPSATEVKEEKPKAAAKKEKATEPKAENEKEATAAEEKESKPAKAKKAK